MKTHLPWAKKEFCQQMVSGLQLQPQLFPGVFSLNIWDLHPDNCVSQFLKMNLSPYLYIWWAQFKSRVSLQRLPWWSVGLARGPAPFPGAGSWKALSGDDRTALTVPALGGGGQSLVSPRWAGQHPLLAPYPLIPPPTCLWAETLPERCRHTENPENRESPSGRLLIVQKHGRPHGSCSFCRSSTKMGDRWSEIPASYLSARGRVSLGLEWSEKLRVGRTAWRILNRQIKIKSQGSKDGRSSIIKSIRKGQTPAE